MNVLPTTIDVMGLRTRVLIEGESTRGDPLVLIHGVGCWAEHWREVMGPIARSGRRAIAVDLPGFGQSEAPKGADYFGPRDAFYPRFVRALLDALAIRSAHVIGNSMGGTVAYTAAVTWPERVTSLSLVASGGLGVDVAHFLRVATLPGAIPFARMFGKPHHAREVLRSGFFDPARITDALYEESERYGLPSFPEFVRVLRSGVTIRGLKRHVRDHWVAQAPSYRGPVLVVWGREDAVLPISHVEGSKGVYPHAEIRIIERCGHLPMLERPDEFVAALLPFIEGAEARAAA